MPQHAKRVKIRRKDLRQPDEFETLTGQLVDWADRNRTTLVAAAVVLVLVATGAFGVGRWRTAQNAVAHEQFRRAHALFDATKYDQAVTAFTELAVEYSRTPMGHLARLYRAHALARSGDAAGAAAAYEEYLATSLMSPYLRQEALTGLGRTKDAAGDTPGALAAYSEAAALDGPFQQDALLAEARLREAGGETDRAREIYARVLKDVPEGDLRAVLVSKLPPGAVPDTAPGADDAAARAPQAGIEVDVQ